MANEKKPSIYDDRSTIGSSSELDEYGVWVKSEPQDLSAVDGEGQEPLEFETGFDDEVSGFDTEEDGGFPDLDIPDGFGMDDNIPGAGIPEDAALPEEDSFSLDSLDTESLETDFALPDLPDPDGETEDAGIDSGGDENFSEISLNDFLGNPDEDEAGVSPEPPEEKGPESENSPSQDLSTQLLMKIADELSSIRSELSTLKQEFSVIRSAAAPGAAEEQPPHGFFDEEDDEKIALTGDELDNIINTAEFTEEAGADVSKSPLAEDESSSVPFPEPEGDLPEGDGDAWKPEADFEKDLNLSLEEPLLDEPALVEFGEDDFSLPMPGEAEEVPAPEDTSYLDESPLAEDDFDLPPVEDTPLIDEPDLPGEIQEENPYIELDLEGIALGEDALDLDLEEEEDSGSPAEDGTGGGPADTDDEEAQEISLDEFLGNPDEEGLTGDAGGGEETGEELIPEGFVVESGETFPSPETAGTEDGGDDLPEEQEPEEPAGDSGPSEISPSLTRDLRTVLSYMDHLLESLPEEKIEEFAKSEYFDTYKKLFKELGLG